MRRHLLSLILISSLAGTVAIGQLRRVPLEERVRDSALVVEGRVLASTSFMEPGSSLIHTSHSIRVYKVLKLGRHDAGEVRTIELVTPGGRVGDELHVVHPALELSPGDAGLFFVDVRPGDAGKRRSFVPHAGALGFIEYTPAGAAIDRFDRYADVERALFARISQQTGEPILVLRSGSAVPAVGADSSRTRELKESDEPESMAAGGGSAGPVVTGFSPSVVTAGTQDVLTIDGSGFGSYSGLAGVLFDDAIDGQGGTFKPIDPEHVVSWSDTQIQVYVPNLTGGKVTAGTGKVIVRDAAGLEGSSASDLTVDYAINEILSYGVVNRVRHIDQNAMGGYTFKHSTSTANGGVDFTSVTGAVDRFDDALESWKCATGWNASVDGTTQITAVGNDGVNIVAFDNDADPLPNGTLGRTTSYFQGCTGDTWRVVGLDIRFRRDGSGIAAWYYGDDPAGQAAGEDDFESVALHELGHALQQDHVNDPADPMYFSVSLGTSKRILSQADIDGGTEIVDLAAGFTACQHTGMIAFDCDAPPSSDFLGAPLGACGTSLAVDFSDMSMNGPTGWSWTFGDAGSSTARHPTHVYSSQGIFTVSLDASNANGSDMEMKSDYVVVTDPPGAAACSPAFSAHNNCCGIGIKNVTLASIDKTSGTASDGDPLLEDFTCSDFGLLQAGASYSISVRTGSGNNEDVKVYIDWNGNGTFEQSELAFESNNTQPVHSGSIVVPPGALQDTALRMRVLSDFASSNITSPCEDIAYGQVEDYSVIVSASPPAGPGAVPASSLTLTKNADPALLDASWSPSCSAGATDYALHEGSLSALYSHAPVVCSTGGATTHAGFAPAAGNRYFLVSPITATDEGSYGRDSSAVERPVSTTTCVATQDISACP